jgi:methylthioribose-1-phosphate isomerase
MKTVMWENNKVVMIDQNKLPNELEYVTMSSVHDVANGIKEMKVRGAPAIGVTAALGLALAAYNSKATARHEFIKDLEKAAEIITGTRPTAVNLFWAAEIILTEANSVKGTLEEAREAIIKKALNMVEEDVQINRKIGEFGANLIEDGDTIGTVCNAGWLATAGEYGTALSPIKVAHEQGKKVNVIAMETRPKLQGARLTAFELMNDGIPVKVIVDGALGHCMSKGMVDKFICGADRIIVKSGGHVANKIGTYMASVLADKHKIPFYVAAPSSTFDFDKDLSELIIEERSKSEVGVINGKWIIPKGANVFNPAFDVTPPNLVKAFITEEGVISPPFREQLKILRC